MLSPMAPLHADETEDSADFDSGDDGEKERVRGCGDTYLDTETTTVAIPGTFAFSVWHLYAIRQRFRTNQH